MLGRGQSILITHQLAHSSFDLPSATGTWQLGGGFPGFPWTRNQCVKRANCGSCANVCLAI